MYTVNSNKERMVYRFMKEFKLNMDEQTTSSQESQESDESKEFESNGYDDETATVERIPEKIYEKVPGMTLVQKLTTVSFIVICGLICIFAIRTVGHLKTMKGYEIPENTVVEDTESTEDENVEYVNQVTYNPKEAAEAELASADNGKDWSSKMKCPYTWTFKSDYEYSSARIKCIWLCTHDETGELLAFRVADYNGGTNEFSDASVYMTQIGGSYIAAD